LGNCNRGLSAAVAATDSWTYVFGALTVASAADLLAAGELLGNAENGRLPLRGRPDSLKGKMIARIPPLPSKQDDIS
jgi:predicted metal-binding protein